MSEMSNFGQQHLQMGRMLDSNLISDLSTPKSKIVHSTIDLWGEERGGVGPELGTKSVEALER
jgi:hypothetical protein